MALYKIFTTPLCGYCAKAESRLARNHLEYEVFDRTDKNEQLLFKMAPQLADSIFLTYPQVFVGKKLIGGCDDLETYEEECLRSR